MDDVGATRLCGVGLSLTGIIVAVGQRKAYLTASDPMRKFLFFMANVRKKTCYAAGHLRAVRTFLHLIVIIYVLMNNIRTFGSCAQL